MSYYFYDTETSGLNPKWQRIMQFAGQRTDDNFKPIGEPDNLLIRLTPDVLPDADAIFVHGITPQKTLDDGINEAAFCDFLMQKAFTPGTIALGYNSIRFDDEFVRYTLYRNYYDPYEREWSDDRGRWDLVDLVRMTRALRPDGINWPVDEDSKPSNRLEALSKANHIEHSDAHDALSDVQATIGLAKLFQAAQPKLFEHLAGLRKKPAVAEFLDAQGTQPFVHSSSKFSSEHYGTSVVTNLTPHPKNQNAVLVFNLRHSPKEFADLSPEELAKRAFTSFKELQEQGVSRLPVKALHLNKAPAVAPLGVLDDASQERISLTRAQIEQHHRELLAIEGFGERLALAWESESFAPDEDPDAQLYDSFINDADRKKMINVRQRKPEDLANWQPQFSDERLEALYMRYRARNFPNTLTADDIQQWDTYRAARLKGSLGLPGIEAYLNRLQVLAGEKTDQQSQFILQELQLYAESIVPFENQQLL